jgi:hypothetical protein
MEIPSQKRYSRNDAAPLDYSRASHGMIFDILTPGAPCPHQLINSPYYLRKPAFLTRPQLSVSMDTIWTPLSRIPSWGKPQSSSDESHSAIMLLVSSAERGISAPRSWGHRKTGSSDAPKSLHMWFVRSLQAKLRARALSEVLTSSHSDQRKCVQQSQQPSLQLTSGILARSFSIVGLSMIWFYPETEVQSNECSACRQLSLPMDTIWTPEIYGNLVVFIIDTSSYLFLLRRVLSD